MCAVDEGEVEEVETDVVNPEDETQEEEVQEDETQDELKIEDFLRTNDGAQMADKEVAVRYGLKTSDVKRIRKAVEGQTANGSQTNGDSNGVQKLLESIPGTPSDQLPDEDPNAVKPGIRTVTARDLDLDGGTRIRDLDPQNIADLTDAMREAKSTAGFGLLEAMFVLELGHTLLTDGFHRITVSQDVFGPDAPWEVMVAVGTYHDALAAAFRANRKHGKKLTREDRILIVERVLDDEFWGSYSDSRIAKLVGEPSRGFIREVRKEWLRKHNLQDPGTRTVERGGKTYQHKAHPERKSENPREVDDQAEDGEMGAGDETAARRKREVQEEYLLAVPCRSHVAPDILPDLDQMALARRELTNAIQAFKSWCERHRAGLGETNPLFVAVERASRIPPAITEGENSRPWVACGKCRDENKLSTGLVHDGDQALTCPACKGTGVKMLGLK